MDESQDLTRSQLMFLKEILNPKSYGSILFIGDTAQSIYHQSWIGSGRSFATIGFNMKGRSNSLSKNYRTTTQISQAAYSLIRSCREIVEDENFVEPALLDKQGDYPVYKAFAYESAQAAYLCREIKALQASRPRATSRSSHASGTSWMTSRLFWKKKGLRASSSPIRRAPSGRTRSSSSPCTRSRGSSSGWCSSSA